MGTDRTRTPPAPTTDQLAAAAGPAEPDLSPATAGARADHRRGLVWAAGLLVAAGASVATAHGLYEVAVAARVPAGIAWLYPLITDGLALDAGRGRCDARPISPRLRQANMHGAVRVVATLVRFVVLPPGQAHRTFRTETVVIEPPLSEDDQMPNDLTAYPPGPFPGEPRPDWGRAWELACPDCGDPGVDRDDGTDGDHAAVTVHPDRDDYDSPLGTRGGYVRVDLVCPAGHRFSLIIANHKGSEFIGLCRRPGR